MTEIPNDRLPNEEPLLSRREILRWGGRGAVVLAAAGGVGVGGYYGFEGIERWLGRGDAESVFKDVMRDSHKFMIYDGLLQIDREAKVANSLFGHPSVREEWAQDGFVIAVRPIAVHGTLLRNIADYSKATQGRVDRVLPEVHPRLMAFYDPGGKLTYLDADANSGLVVPLSAEAPDTSDFSHLPVSDVNIQGRELRGNVIYPYTKSLYKDFRSGKIVENYYFIGQSTSAETGANVNAVASDYFYGTDPIPFPSA